MIFKELVEKFNWDLVEARIRSIYPDQEKNLNGYKRVLKELKNLKPKLPEDKMEIEVHNVKDKDGDYTEVHGRKKDDKTGWAIEYTEWEEWLGMEINKKSLKNFSELDILVYCLWEMTWSGYSNKEVKKSAKELFSQYGKAIKQISKEKNAIKTN